MLPGEREKRNFAALAPLRPGIPVFLIEYAPGGRTESPSNTENSDRCTKGG
jgi:hypothetical protein